MTKDKTGITATVNFVVTIKSNSIVELADRIKMVTKLLDQNKIPYSVASSERLGIE